MPEGHAQLDEFPAVVRIPVQWGEMDAYDHVNNVVFFRHFESARIEYLEACGFVASYEEDRVGAILHSTDCRFRRPLRYPDTVLVGARAESVGEDRFVMGYRTVSLGQDAIAAEGTGTVVSYDYEAGTRTAIPETVRRGIRELEGASEERRAWGWYRALAVEGARLDAAGPGWQVLTSARIRRYGVAPRDIQMVPGKLRMSRWLAVRGKLVLFVPLRRSRIP